VVKYVWEWWSSGKILGFESEGCEFKSDKILYFLSLSKTLKHTLLAGEQFMAQ
jgi:hypothetical protein